MVGQCGPSVDRAWTERGPTWTDDFSRNTRVLPQTLVGQARTGIKSCWCVPRGSGTAGRRLLAQFFNSNSFLKKVSLQQQTLSRVFTDALKKKSSRGRDARERVSRTRSRASVKKLPRLSITAQPISSRGARCCHMRLLQPEWLNGWHFIASQNKLPTT